MAADDELLALFAEEAEQRLAELTAHLLALEEAGNDAELVAATFREAHTLKGGAAVVGLTAFSDVAHAMEDLLEELRSGGRMATPASPIRLSASSTKLTRAPLLGEHNAEVLGKVCGLGAEDLAKLQAEGVI